MSGVTFDTAAHPRDAHGRFVASRPDGETQLPATVTVTNKFGERVTLDPGEFGWAAVDVYEQGQCAALAYALADEFEGLPIKVALDRSETVLVHAWLEDEGFMIDAGGRDYVAAEFLDDIWYQWGDLTVVEHTKDSLREWMDLVAPGNQDWASARIMAPAWRRRYL